MLTKDSYLFDQSEMFVHCCCLPSVVEHCLGYWGIPMSHVLLLIIRNRRAETAFSASMTILEYRGMRRQIGWQHEEPWEVKKTKTAAATCRKTESYHSWSEQKEITDPVQRMASGLD